jgi:hypothetical protein
MSVNNLSINNYVNGGSASSVPITSLSANASSSVTMADLAGSYTSKRFDQIDADTQASVSIMEQYQLQADGTCSMVISSYVITPNNVVNNGGYDSVPALGHWSIRKGKVYAVLYDSFTYLDVLNNVNEQMGDPSKNSSKFIIGGGEITRYLRVFTVASNKELTRVFSKFIGLYNTAAPDSLAEVDVSFPGPDRLDTVPLYKASSAASFFPSDI